jgi:hypothetical protein
MSNPGRDLPREMASEDRVDAQIDAFITRRDEKRRESEGARAAEAAWREAERRLETRRRPENRAGWYGRMARRSSTCECRGSMRPPRRGCWGRARRERATV